MTGANNKEKITVPVQLTTATIERLVKVSNYVAFKEKREETVEDTIKAAIADYLQVMEPLPTEEVNTLRSLIFQPGIEKPYALKNRFKEIMKQKGLKAVNLHRDTDISESNLSQILNNKNQNMSLDYFLRIWFALGCPPLGECLYRENI